MKNFLPNQSTRKKTTNTVVFKRIISPSRSLYLFLFFALSIVYCESIQAQNYNRDILGPAHPFYRFTVNNLPNVNCSGTSGDAVCATLGGTSNCPTYNAFLDTTDYVNYHVAERGQTFTLDFSFIELVDPATPEFFIRYDFITDVGTPDQQVILGPDYFTGLANAGISTHNFSLDFTPQKGMTDAVLRIFAISFGGAEQYNLYVPIIVTGAVADSVPVLGSSITPQIPYMILHDPPGDGSFSEFQETTSFCREFSETYTESVGNNSSVGVKLGVAGSAGFIVSTEFEFSVEISANLSINSSQTTSGSYERCIEVTQGFATSDLDVSIGDGADVFIGYGQTLYYGIFESVDLDSVCIPYLKSGLTYYSDENAITTFVKTANGIQNDIAAQQAIANNTSLPDDVRNRAFNQIDVWNNVLLQNTLNVANATEQIGSYSFDGGGLTISEETALTTNTTTTYDTELNVETGVGMEAVIEVAGNGVNGSTEMTFSSNYGTSQSQGSGTTEMVKYTLTDDDSGDFFDLNVFRDPSYGTPIFRLQPGSKTSCPYEGGIRRDRPSLNADTELCDLVVGAIYLDSIAVDSASIITLNICNDASEARSYDLKLLTNLLGADVRISNTPLNAGSTFNTYDIPANDCVSPTLTIKKNPSTPNVNVYNDMVLSLYPACEPDADAQLSLNVTFGGAGNYPLMDSDCDYTPDVIDVCQGFPDYVDAEGDGVPDGCDNCSTIEDPFDINNNGICDFSDSLVIGDTAGYHFEQLNTGAIGGQDNWVGNGFVVTTSNSGSYVGSNAIEFGYSDVYRKNDSIWSMPTIDDCVGAMVIEFDLIGGAVSRAPKIQLGYDMDDNGNFNGSGERGIGVQFYPWDGGGGAFPGVTLLDANGGGHGFGNGTYPNQVERYRMVIYFKTLNGEGTATLYRRSLSNNGNWEIAVSHENMNFDFTAVDATNPMNYNAIIFNDQGNSSGIQSKIDNIQTRTFSISAVDLALSGNQLTSQAYQAANTIVSSQQIHAPAQVLYQASQLVELLPNTEIMLGAELEVLIDANVCNN